MEEKPNKPEPKRQKNGTFGPGNNANPAGRPKGKTLKEFAREMLMTMNDEEKIAYLKQLPPEIVWRMAEGNPSNSTDLTTGGDKLESQVVGLTYIAPPHDPDHKADA